MIPYPLERLDQRVRCAPWLHRYAIHEHQGGMCFAEHLTRFIHDRVIEADAHGRERFDPCSNGEQVVVSSRAVIGDAQIMDR